MEKKEITLLDLVKIAARWIWVLVLGAVICAAVAYFYSSNMVTPLYSASSKFVIQTKNQDSNSDVLESQRTVAYAQLAVGTYIDIVDTRNFAEHIATYMNGKIKGISITKNAVNTLICQAILLDGGITDTVIDENGNTVPSQLRNNIDYLADNGVLKETVKTMSCKSVVKERFQGNYEKQLKAQGYTQTPAEIDEKVEELLEMQNLVPIIVQDEDLFGDDIYSGDSLEKVGALKALGLGDGKSYKGIEYTAGAIRGKMAFSAAKEESTTFHINITSTDAEEAYTIARVCEIVIKDYMDERYPGIGVISTIDSARMNSAPINNNTVLMTLIGFVGGFLLAFVVVYIIELSDNRIKNEEELSEKTGLSVVGIIPDMTNDKGNSGYYYYSYERRVQ